ncbi:hypothetical protein C7120_08755 [Prevotella sp. oral taxon 376]|nr:hypothetical protein C7120_08755 [Prevotella sp. oral taxon 376]
MFEDKADAIAWSDGQVKGKTPLDERDNECDYRNTNFWYEVYDTSTATEDDPVGDMVHRTEKVYY